MKCKFCLEIIVWFQNRICRVHIKKKEEGRKMFQEERDVEVFLKVRIKEKKYKGTVVINGTEFSFEFSKGDNFSKREKIRRENLRESISVVIKQGKRPINLSEDEYAIFFNLIYPSLERFVAFYIVSKQILGKNISLYKEDIIISFDEEVCRILSAEKFGCRLTPETTYLAN